MDVPGVLTTQYMTAEELVKNLELGDLIEFSRPISKHTAYKHWALYIGEFENKHFAIHYSMPNSDFGMRDKAEITSKLTFRGSSAHVRSDLIENIAGDSLCRINNSMDLHCSPFPPNVIYERAIFMLGRCGYNIFYQNCEHFVKECRYGSAQSDQVSMVSSVIGGVLVGAASFSLPLGIVSGAAAYTMLKYKQQIRNWIPKLPSVFARSE